MTPNAIRFRSWMFVPGHRPRMVEKALGLTNLDAVMLDIEDGVAPLEKEAARRQIAATLDQLQESAKNELAKGSAAPRTPARYVRINAIGHERMHADLGAVVRPGLEGLVLPKVETPEQVKIVVDILGRREREMGLPDGAVRLLVAIESPRGLLNSYAIASSSPAVMGLIFGAEDYGKEMGLPLRREAEAQELIYARSAIANAAAAAHVQAIDAVWPDLKDMPGLQKFALQSRRLGFTGMSAIHPSQSDPINAVFSPTPEEIDYCRQIVKTFEEAESRGSGASAYQGQLVDLPVVERARRTLALAESLGVATNS